MRAIDECLRLNSEIKTLKEQIAEVKAAAMSPKNQIISDMPKGGGTTNAAESYIIRIEQLENKLNRLVALKEANWSIVCAVLEEYSNEKTEKLLTYRLQQGLSWRRCVVHMKGDYPDEKWNANKCFYLYRRFVRGK